MVIDHNNEETVQEVLDRGFWAAFTLYPETKMGSERFVEIARRYGSTRIFIDSSADWGKSDPLAVPKTARLMLERGIPRADVEATCYANALAAFGQSGQMKEEHWLSQQATGRAAALPGQFRVAWPAAARGRSPGHPRTRRATGDQVSTGHSGKGAAMNAETAKVVELTAATVYQQEFTIRYDYPVYFTDRVFDRDNPVFAHALSRRESGKRHRFAAFVDANVAASWPALVHEIAAYAQAHAATMDLVAPPEVVPAGEQVKNDPALVTRLQQRLGELAIDRHSYVVGVGGGALLDMIGFRRGDHAPRRAPHPRSHHRAGAERFRRRREERHQRVREEEFPRLLRPSPRGPE